VRGGVSGALLGPEGPAGWRAFECVGGWCLGLDLPWSSHRFVLCFGGVQMLVSIVWGWVRVVC
jgi:hypothetical protein